MSNLGYIFQPFANRLKVYHPIATTFTSPHSGIDETTSYIHNLYSLRTATANGRDNIRLRAIRKGNCIDRPSCKADDSHKRV